MTTRNIVLIGMPGAGKSTIGVMAAKQWAKDFIDTDVLIQVVEGRALQEIVNQEGHLHLRAIEERVILGLDCTNHVIATGGSAAYSESAMQHLARQGTIVFLDVPFEVIETRVSNFGSRGIARRPDQTLRDLYVERLPLYRRYAAITLDCGTKSQAHVCEELLARVERWDNGRDL